ncbi:disease resistance protein RGA2-like [Lolium rigidum]|uniref:disease resistance protein RGA2-like n=1 Tax=Lolium rigidum TaxID=89674 RepID=UPI001F5C940F|nr:disease resistance protein RGA2-like [Lolium rigidum]
MASGVAVFAGKAIATSVISYIINKAFDYLKDNKTSGGLKSTKERLERVLPQIQVVFDAVDTEPIRNQSEALDAWLWQLRDAVEEAEDALDDLEYCKLEEEAKLQDNKVRGSLHKYKGKVIQQVNHVFNSGSMKRLRRSVMTLDEVAAGVDRFFQVLNHLDNDKMKNHKQDVEFKNWRQTSSLSDGLLLGREEERKVVVDWLTKPESDAVEQIVSNLAVFSVIGIGGMGKTTLAQVICNIKEVKEYFDFVIWVCVSHSFDIETLTKKILEDVTGEGATMIGLNALHKALKEKLQSKNFLLVLDDVWNDERVHDWEKFLRPLRYGKKGSKILLTTRMQSVADVAARTVQGECQSLRLSGMEEADLLLLLNMHAFSGVDPDDYRNLQQISKKMVSKLSGSPLAAKVLGGLLNNNMDSSTWNKILASGVHNIQQGNEGIMAVLKLSYQHLPTHLQACFRYCSLFQKYYEFTKKELVHLWTGAGLIQQPVDDIMPEDIGLGYLVTLSRKSFFDIKSRPCLSRAIKGNLFDEYYEERFVMHDLLHVLAQSASVSECTRVDLNFLGSIPKTVRHIRIEMINPAVVEQISHANKLRTLLMHFEDQDEALQEHIIRKVLRVAKSLRVLSITTNSPCKLPKAVGGLMHLRYLSLMWGRKRMTHFGWFPKPVYKIYHLQVMKFDNPQLTAPEKREMEGVCNLVNLRHLQLSYGIIPMIPYVGKLTSLEELHNFRIKQDSGYTIGELKNLKKLCHLYVSDLDKVKSAEEAAEVMLDQKENLLAVRLGWSASSYNSSERSQAEMVLDKLQPHSNSHKLKIDGYPGSRSPCWLQTAGWGFLPVSKNICNCERLQHLPPLGQLDSLQYLYIINLASVECVDSSFYGNDKPAGLQYLKVLEIESMPKLVEWVGSEGVNLFPRLDTLIVRNCEVLRSLPSVPISIEHVEIHRAGLRAMPTFFVSSDTNSSAAASLDLALSKLMIFHCQNLETLWQGCSLSAVEELSIQQCASLSCLPEDSFGSLSSLKTLQIVKCPNLVTGEIRLPPTVKTITLGLCGDAETPLLHSMRGLNLLERLFLDGCLLAHLPSEVFACLVGLTDMMISDCAITSLPSAEAFAKMKNLINICIWDCKELVSINGIQGIPSLMSLQISGCSKITADSYVEMVDDSTDFPGLALKLDELDIDNPSLLLREPLRSISCVKKLRIVGGAELRHLPEEWLLQNQALKELEVSDASHLICLAPQLANMSSMESFHISNAKLIQSLPGMPISLRYLQINNCHPELKKRCRKNGGPDWMKIAHICNVNIS